MTSHLTFDDACFGQDCPAGTYEEQHRMCRTADSFSFVASRRRNASALEHCPSNMRVLTIRDRMGEPVPYPAEGATSLEQCTCIPDTYTPYPELWLTAAYPRLCIP